MGEPEVEGFLPVDGRTVGELEQALSALAVARGKLAHATRALVELAEDMKTDAVRRLTERGASSAQVERYEEAYRASRGAVDASASGLDEACARMSDAVRAVRG